MSRLFANNPKVGPHPLDDRRVEKGRLELAQQFLAIYGLVLLLHLVQGLLQALMDDPPQTIRRKVVGKYASVDRPSARRAKATAIDKLSGYSFVDGSKWRAAPPPAFALGGPPGARQLGPRLW